MGISSRTSLSLADHVFAWPEISDVIELQQFEECKCKAYSMALSPDGTLVSYGYNDGTMRVWDLRDGTPVGEPLQGHDGEVNSIAFSSDSDRAVSGSDDLTVRIWDVCDGVQIGEPLRGHEEIVWTVAFSPDGSRIASGSRDDTFESGMPTMAL